MNKLKPCPFCGCKKIKITKTVIRCKGCGCIKPTAKKETDESKIARWNHRIIYINGIQNNEDKCRIEEIEKQETEQS